MKKRLFAMLLALAMVLTGCGGGAEPAETTKASGETQPAGETDDKVFNVGIGRLADNFNFFEEQNGFETYSMSQVYDLLIAKDETGYIPWLAEKWEISEDAKTYTFHINPKATWSDGTPVTSADVEFSFGKLKESAYTSYIYEPILDTIECPDEHTCVVHLVRGNVGFMEYLSHPYYCSILSKAAFEKYGDEYGKSVDKIVGSGPYVVTDWKVGESISYEARDDWYLGTPAIKHVKLVPIAEAASGMLAIQSGQLDAYFDDIPGVSYDTVDADENISIFTWPSTIQFDIFFNTMDSEIFKNVKMRQAVAMAINKQDFVTVGVEGYGTTANYPGDRDGGNVADPMMHDTWEQMYPQDIEKAKAIVEECGYTGAKVEIKTYSNEPYPALATVLQSAMQSIGLDAYITECERAGYSQTVLTERQFEVQLIRWAAGTEDFDEFLYGSLHTDSIGPAGNWSFYSNEKLDELILKAQSATDEAERTEYHKQIMQIFMDEVIYISLYYPTSSRAVGNRVVLRDGCAKFDKFFYYSWK